MAGNERAPAARTHNTFPGQDAGGHRKQCPGRALGAALMSSLVAGLEGAVILAVSIPIMRPLVLFFGAPELFMLTILGITFLATLSSSSLSKGVLAGGIGLAISAVGIEDHTGTLRYTMGTIYLWEGLSLAPVVVGLFAIPEIVDLAHLRAGTSAHSFPDRVRIPWRLFGKQRFRGYRGGLCFRRAGLFHGPFRMAEGSVRARPRLGAPCGEVPRDLARRLRHGLASPSARNGHDGDIVGQRCL